MTAHGGAPADEAREEARVLFLDAYDSFTNNIVALLKDALGGRVRVHVVHMDLRLAATDGYGNSDDSPGSSNGHGISDDGPDYCWTPRELLARLAGYDAVVCGPGPGSPLRAADVGAFRLLWELPAARAVPVLGICLGFQSLVAHFGGRVRRLRRGLHGMVRAIDHAGGRAGDIFDAVGPFRATLYHSLCVDVGQDAVAARDWPVARWAAPARAPDIVPLAWALEPADGDDARGPERILMAARHASRPLWGVQYHPESVCTEPAAHQVIRNWFRHAAKWNEAAGRRVDRSIPCPDTLDPAVRSLPGLDARRGLPAHPWWRDLQTGLARSGVAPRYACRALKLPGRVETADVAELLGLGASDTIILDSSSTVNGDPLARNSIIALDVQQALRIEYRVGDAFVTLRAPASQYRAAEECQRIRLSDGTPSPWTPWHVISEFWRARQIPDDEAQPSAFKGGLMGFVTYEMGLSTVSPGLVPQDRGHRRPDICLAWVSKSIVLDHKAGVAYVQALATADSDAAWIDGVAETLRTSDVWRRGASGSSSSSSSVTAAPVRSNEALLSDVRQGQGRLRFAVPDSDAYEEDVRRCQDAIRDGESYELCLTAQTTMTRPAVNDVPDHLRLRPTNGSGGIGTPPRAADACPDGGWSHGTPWDMYRTLRSRQPAPFGSFIRMGGATLISSSPERFLKHDGHGLCSMRPMKGTVRKSEAVSTLAEAERILHVPKEEAENLMIVDLVRHDLHGVCGAGGVTVPDLLRVEEYATVFQMSTVVEGRLPTAAAAGGAKPGPRREHGGGDGGERRCRAPLTGLDVLASALPPGSMTGAPKKRSCELLAALEPAERGAYSGVIGYLDAQGRGDWSVTIRTLFRWDDEATPAGDEVWRIGAGGAVTTLSTPEGERDEMLTKLCGPLGVLRDVA